jgi:hypothetical protein
LLHLELPTLALGQGLEALALDGRMVDEHIFAAVGGLMNPKPLASLNHLTVL